MMHWSLSQRACVGLLGGLLAGLAITAAAIAQTETNAAAKSGNSRHRPRLLLSLPDDCNTPDGMRLDPKTGDVILACPNFADPKYPGKLMKITPDNRLELYFDQLPVHPKTGRVSPMGLDFGPDGNLYVADNQYFADKNYRSRLLRVTVRDGKPVSAAVAVEGFKLANAVMWKGDSVYVTDTFFDLPGKFGTGGVYRFSLEELRRGTVTLKPKDQADPHLVASFPVLPNARQDPGGCDGLTFDRQGNLYTGNFGDGQLFKITFHPDGTTKSTERLIGPPQLTCVDGLFCDTRTGKIYVADSQRNAIQVVLPDGSLETLWENDDTTGEDGLLDQPCETLVRGNELIVVNFDVPFPGLKNRQADRHHTISVIRLD
jgi:sugar lactone lactonase YvrE